MADPDDKTVKHLLDAGTRAELERWFGLPSFEQLADQGKTPAPPPPEDPKFAEARKRREAALAAVDPAMLEAHRRRVEPRRPMTTFDAVIELRIDPDIGQFDQAIVARQLAEPRELDLPSDLADDLRECAPQALLRDLHRTEVVFEKRFEWVDAIAEHRVNASAIAAEAMATSWAAPRPTRSAFAEARAILIETRGIRRRPWIEIAMPNRKVTE
jgi:hypothetical protein